MSDFDDIMDLLGPSVAPFEPSSQEVSRPAPPTVRDTTSEANVWLPTSVAAHYKEYDRSGTAVDELEALIARDGLLTPIRISTDGRVAVIHEGNHRLQVAQRLCISEVPAIVTFDDPVVSNGGRVTPLEPVLGSWVGQNRGRLRSFWGHRTATSAASLVWPEGRSAMKIASSDIIARGFKFDEVGFELAQKYMNGTMTGRDILQEIETKWGSVGIWWGSVGNTSDDFYGSVGQARDYAGWAGDGSIEHRWEDMLRLTGGEVDPSEWMDAEIRVVLVAKKPMRDYGFWNPTIENGEGSMSESSSFFERGERLELVEIQYAADYDGDIWKSEAVGGLTVTAHRTAANDLRVHLFDSQGHEMWLEPDFDGNPWTYHPKVMDAVRFLADVAQEDGVYWHMDHNEFIPSTITDFKVFDGSNDVTHEIKEFPQLRGRYASRTAYVSDDIYESYYDTDRLVNLVMNAYTWDGNGPLWELVANSPEEAKAFFDSLDEDERRVNVSEVLENGGWDLSGIGHKFSNRTSASTPSAPGILYRGLAVPFSEAQLEDVMEAYGKESFVGRVLGYLSRGFFTPNREWGLGKHWTTNINVAKSFSQNGFGTPVVLVAEWDGSGEDPYNAPGNNFGGEDEVTLLPETELRLVDVLWGPTFESIGGSGRTITAAEPGGVLPWTPSHRGYTWITKTDGTLEAVTNDGVNRMFLHEYPYGWEWEVFDSLGFVEGGTFGMALKGGDALRQRANELLSEFDTRAEMRTRGPSRGYQDDYTPAPNTLWSKRATTSQRYAERMRRHRLR